MTGIWLGMVWNVKKMVGVPYGSNRGALAHRMIYGIIRDSMNFVFCWLIVKIFKACRILLILPTFLSGQNPSLNILWTIHVKNLEELFQLCFPKKQVHCISPPPANPRLSTPNLRQNWRPKLSPTARIVWELSRNLSNTSTRKIPTCRKKNNWSKRESMCSYCSTCTNCTIVSMNKASKRFKIMKAVVIQSSSCLDLFSRLRKRDLKGRVYEITEF